MFSFQKRPSLSEVISGNTRRARELWKLYISIRLIIKRFEIEKRFLRFKKSLFVILSSFDYRFHHDKLFFPLF